MHPSYLPTHFWPAPTWVSSTAERNRMPGWRSCMKVSRCIRSFSASSSSVWIQPAQQQREGDRVGALRGVCAPVPQTAEHTGTTPPHPNPRKKESMRPCTRLREPGGMCCRPTPSRPPATPTPPGSPPTVVALQGAQGLEVAPHSCNHPWHTSHGLQEQKALQPLGLAHVLVVACA